MKNDEWNIQDFYYDKTTITGFSETGKEKFKTNKDVILPSLNQMGEEITEIGDQSFLIADFTTKKDPDIGINSVKLPDTIKIIGKEAFRFNALTSINLPQAVTTIKISAFNGNKIKTLVIPESVTTLEGGAFTMNEISSLTLPSTIKVVPPAFAFNKLTTLTIPEGITRIDDLAFSDNELTEVELPSTLKYLSGFNNNSFKSIRILENVEEIGFKAFASNKMTSVTIPGNVKLVGKRAFWNTWHDQYLNSVTIKEGVEKLAECSFKSNQLKEVKLPSSLKEIGKGAFNKNIGYKGVVHLFTPDYKNIHNIISSEKHIINPAKITVKYKFLNIVLKEEHIFKNPVTGSYFHIGDRGVGVIPKYACNKYELKDIDSRTINLRYKENIVVFKCNKKEEVEKVRVNYVGKVGSAVVDFGTDKNTAIDKLPKKTFITDTNYINHKVLLRWSIKNYNGNISGEYKAIGTFKLPYGVLQSQAQTKLETTANIIVKEELNTKDNKWKVEDFAYDGLTVTGLSDSGRERIKTNKNLVLPKTNKLGQTISYIGSGAFKEIGLECVVIPKGILEIDTFAFFKNKLKYVDFPGTIKRVGNQAFAKNRLADISFLEGADTPCLDSLSFMGNQLTSITTLKKVKKVHEDVFKDNMGHQDDSRKVYIYLSGLDPKNNGLFKNSAYHKIINLPVKSTDEVATIDID